MSDNLLDCKCGNPVDLDWGGVCEYWGGTWQDCAISCLKCGREASITVNADFPSEAEAAEKIVIDAWNKLQRGIADSA